MKLRSAFGISGGEGFFRAANGGWRAALPTVLLILVAALAATVACGGNGGSKHAGTETVRGLVQEVKSASLLELSAITVEDDDGVQWRIEGGGEKVSGFSPSHLREHMALGLPVTVTFHREDGKLVLDEIKD